MNADRSRVALQVLKLSGFSPIITTASARNEAYCKSAGATHVIDYNAVSYAELSSKVTELLGSTPPTVVYDAISTADSQKAAWAALAPKGKLVVTLEPAVGVKPGEEAEEGKTLVHAYGMSNEGENLDFSVGMYGAITGWLESGVLKVSLKLVHFEGEVRLTMYLRIDE